MAASTVKRLSSNTAIMPVIVTILSLAPFLDKAFHMDDPLFIWAGRHIQSDPADFYGFSVNWSGTEMQMVDAMKNPPLTCYYIALVGSLFGWSEVSLHIAFLIPAAAMALGVYYLAKNLCSLPAIAALASVLTPAFLVSSTNVMSDTMMLTLWVWAIFFWMLGMRKDKQLSLLFSAVLISICALTKYFGMSLIVLLLLYSLMQKRELGLWVLFLLIPVVVLAGYQWITHSLYGRGLLSDAAAYATEHRWEGSAYFMKGLIGLTFAGGCMITVLFYTPLLWSRRVLVMGTILMVLLIFGLSLEERVGEICIRDVGGIRWGFLIQIGLMFITGVSLLALAGADFWRYRDAESLLLLLWVVGTFIFAGFVNWTTNARSLLPMAPAVGILLMRRIDCCNKINQQRRRLWWVIWPLVPAAFVALMVCWADYRFADTARSAAGIVQKKFENRDDKIWFGGHWGFQYYMEAAGGMALDFKHSEPEQGDIIVFPLNNTCIEPLTQIKAPPTHTFRIGPLRWVATMNPWLGAGFYADEWGPLPYFIGPVEPEEYHSYIVN